MSRQIDLLKFEELSGGMAWMPLLAEAFLRQLPPWRTTLHAAMAAQDAAVLADHLHKMKGACYAVAAYDAAEVFAETEAVLALGDPETLRVALPGLLDRLRLVEDELASIIAAGPVRSGHST